jgi:DNA-binding transcriptional LysR family regulator
LREQLGDTLFIRQGRGVVPTPIAVRMAPAIQEALAGLERALLGRREFDPRRDLTRLTIGLPDELESLFLPAIFGRLGKFVPHLSISAVRLKRAQMRGDLAASRMDVALDVAQPAAEDILHEKVLEDSFCVVAAGGRETLEREDYLAAGHVAVSSRPTGPAVEDFRFDALGVTRRVVVRCQRYETACQIVAASDLLLTMPGRLAAIRRRLLDLSVFPPPLPLPGIEIHLFWHRQTAESPAGLWIREELKKALSAGP